MPFDLRLLKPEDALPTFALARLYDPALIPGDWTAQLQRPASTEGTFAAFGGPTARALARYIITRTTDGVEVLVIRWVTAFDLIDPERVALELIAAVRARAEQDHRLVAWSPCAREASGFERAVAGEAVLHSVL